MSGCPLCPCGFCGLGTDWERDRIVAVRRARFGVLCRLLGGVLGGHSRDDLEDGLGRGLIHEARYLEPGEDSEPERTLRIAHQELPDRIMGLFPKSQVWRILRLLNNDAGMREYVAALR